MNFAFLLSALFHLFNAGAAPGDVSAGHQGFAPADTSGVLTGARVDAKDTSGVLTGMKIQSADTSGVLTGARVKRTNPSGVTTGRSSERARAMDTSGVISG